MDAKLKYTDSIQMAYSSIITYGEPFVSQWRYKIPCVGVPKKSTRFYRLYLVGIDSMCYINSTSSGKDRLNVFYQLDSRSLGEKASFEGELISRLSMACNKGARLRQGTETLEATGTPTADQSS